MFVQLCSEEKPAFRKANGTFYCNICKKYTGSFSLSNVKNKDRRCKECISQTRYQRIRRTGHLQRLKLKLHQNLRYQNKNYSARMATENWIANLLSEHGIEEIDYKLVKTMKAMRDPKTNQWNVVPVFYNINDLMPGGHSHPNNYRDLIDLATAPSFFNIARKLKSIKTINLVNHIYINPFH